MLLKTVLTTPSALYKKNITHVWMLICWKMNKKNHLYCVTQLASCTPHTPTQCFCVFSSLFTVLPFQVVVAGWFAQLLRQLRARNCLLSVPSSSRILACRPNRGGMISSCVGQSPLALPHKPTAPSLPCS